MKNNLSFSDNNLLNCLIKWHKRINKFNCLKWKSIKCKLMPGLIKKPLLISWKGINIWRRLLNSGILVKLIRKIFKVKWRRMIRRRRKAILILKLIVWGNIPLNKKELIKKLEWLIIRYYIKINCLITCNPLKTQGLQLPRHLALKGILSQCTASIIQLLFNNTSLKTSGLTSRKTDNSTLS